MVKNKNKHSAFGPSSIKRRIMCPASYKLENEAPPREDTEHSKMGDLAHNYAEWYLKKELGLKYNIPNDNITLRDLTDAPEEMKNSVHVYTDYALELIKTKRINKTNIFIEQAFFLDWIEKDCKGTTDLTVYDARKGVLYVIDYKNGTGVDVSPEWNYQAMFYALGAVNTVYNQARLRGAKDLDPVKLVKEVTIVIVQPNSYTAEEKIKEWVISTANLFFWARTVLMPGIAACKTEAPLIRPGEHCKFCKAMPVCPEQHKSLEIISNYQEPNKPNPDQLADILNRTDHITSMCAKIKDYALKTLMDGVAIPGYKLVRKSARRKWANEAYSAEVLKGILGEKAFSKKLKSVNQIESILSNSDFVDITMLWEKPEGTPTIAKTDDRRKEYLPHLNAADFIDFLN